MSNCEFEKNISRVGRCALVLYNLKGAFVLLALCLSVMLFEQPILRAQSTGASALRDRAVICDLEKVPENKMSRHKPDPIADCRQNRGYLFKNTSVLGVEVAFYDKNTRKAHKETVSFLHDRKRTPKVEDLLYDTNGFALGMGRVYSALKAKGYDVDVGELRVDGYHLSKTANLYKEQMHSGCKDVMTRPPCVQEYSIKELRKNLVGTVSQPSVCSGCGQTISDTWFRQEGRDRRTARSPASEKNTCRCPGGPAVSASSRPESSCTPGTALRCEAARIQPRPVCDGRCRVLHPYTHECKVNSVRCLACNDRGVAKWGDWNLTCRPSRKAVEGQNICAMSTVQCFNDKDVEPGSPDYWLDAAATATGSAPSSTLRNR